MNNLLIQLYYTREMCTSLLTIEDSSKPGTSRMSGWSLQRTADDVKRADCQFLALSKLIQRWKFAENLLKIASNRFIYEDVCRSLLLRLIVVLKIPSMLTRVEGTQVEDDVVADQDEVQLHRKNLKYLRSTYDANDSACYATVDRFS